MTTTLNTYEVLISLTGSKRLRIEAESSEAAAERAENCEWSDANEIDCQTHDITVCDITLVSGPPLIAALQQALAALNSAPRFRVPSLGTDSYAIAALCDRAIAGAKGGVQ